MTTTRRDLPTEQKNLEWRFNEAKGVIFHEDDEDEEGNCEDCDICFKFSRHYHPLNGKAESLDKAKSARDHWFRQNLHPFKDSVEQHELTAKTEELERVRGELTGKCLEVERLRTRLNIAENALEDEQRQRTFMLKENSQLKRLRQEDDKERLRLDKEVKHIEEWRALVAGKLSESLVVQGLQRRDLKVAGRKFKNTRRELENARRELEDARRELVRLRPPPPGPVEDATTSSAVALSSGHPQDEVYIVLSP
jgi:hypothetical protein